MKIGIAVSKLRLAAEGENVVQGDRDRIVALAEACKGNTAQLDLAETNEEVLQNLLKDDLSEAQRRAIVLFVTKAGANPFQLIDSVVGSPAEFHNALTGMTKGDEPNAEIQIGERWYPIVLKSDIQKYDGSAYCSLTSNYSICDNQQSLWMHVSESTFMDENDQEITYTVRELLLKLGLRPLGDNLRDHFLRLKRANRVGELTGAAYDVTGTVVTVETRSWWKGMDVINLGSEAHPSPCVVEGEMESNKDQGRSYYNRGNNQWHLPFVRVFSLDRKTYCYADIDDLVLHKYQEGVLETLVLPDEMTAVLRQVFDAPIDQLFGDFLDGKSGGMIVLASGTTGVGKTMTAEVFANHTKRPLYVLEMGELGTTLASVEDNLRKVFRRAARWNAVLLFDEADVFMAQRDDNLERSAIVGVFLRLLDYYHGLMFLTSNRPDVIDKAFKSRITLHLEYPDLDRARRLRIWNTMLAKAGITLNGDIDGVPDVELNGRQIRNMVRLVRVLHGTTVTPMQLTSICRFTAK